MKSEYQGWKNRGTWNVALYISNEYPLYRAALALAQPAPVAPAIKWTSDERKSRRRSEPVEEI